MHSAKNPTVPIGDQACPELRFPYHIHGIDFDFSPSVVCPRNFIIFDRSHNKRNQIVFHPDMTPPTFSVPDLGGRKRTAASLSKEDSADIDALLSSDDYEEEEEEEEEGTVDPDDDMVSTARTGVTYDCSSPDSCSNYEPMRKRKKTEEETCSGDELTNGEDRWEDDERRQEVQKMVKALKRIVPGAELINGAGVLDEAVGYLKALRVEVKKMEAEKSSR
ncbi:hypothetical protein M569_12192 [Genlisea aurea]|uniref:BHLH domain-containing protein n=1 Tax=Genlisea aurea TaxID=192259 RepID=S8DIG6_9LAMI|nr:hypothetical protein M569_12192 [Genlisea aurea]